MNNQKPKPVIVFAEHGIVHRQVMVKGDWAVYRRESGVGTDLVLMIIRRDGKLGDIAHPDFTYDSEAEALKNLELMQQVAVDD
jgi:hypothetical protein